MRRARDWEVVEVREAVRLAAYELARSGVCERWQDVWRVLRAHFSVVQLTSIFDNPLCQLDINQRCRRARSPVKPDSEATMPEPAIGRNGFHQIARSKPPIFDREMQRPGRLAERIQALLADGRECTAIQLAEQLGTSRHEVLVTVRSMLADGVLQVTRRLAAKRGGRGARVFAHAGMATRQMHDELGSPGPWPVADPVVTAAIDAIARHR